MSSLYPTTERPYTWVVEQATQLDHLHDAVDRNPDEPCFLGSVVLDRGPNVPKPL